MKFTISDTAKVLLAEFNYPLFKGTSLDKLRAIAYDCEVDIREIEHEANGSVVVHFILNDDRDDLCKSIATIIGDLQMSLYDFVLLEDESPYVEI